ncbi:MAG: hypothetical protein PVJ57_03800 [Phycisphaerae bacterium]|jgi:hypothetical protein
MIVRGLLVCCAVALFVSAPTMAAQEWLDDMEAYRVGSYLGGQGGWEGWDGVSYMGAASVVSLRAHSPVASFVTWESINVVHPFSGYTEGQWTFSAWQYAESDRIGDSWVNLLNTYDVGNHNWSTRLRFDPDLDVIESQSDGAQLPLILDEWVQLRVEIDLDANMQSVYYGDDLLTTKSWTEGETGGGALNIGGISFEACPYASMIWYDDISLTPEPGTCLLLVLGAVALRRR